MGEEEPLFISDALSASFVYASCRALDPGMPWRHVLPNLMRGRSAAGAVPAGERLLVPQKRLQLNSVRPGYMELNKLNSVRLLGASWRGGGCVERLDSVTVSKD